VTGLDISENEIKQAIERMKHVRFWRMGWTIKCVLILFPPQHGEKRRLAKVPFEFRCTAGLFESYFGCLTFQLLPPSQPPQTDLGRAPIPWTHSYNTASCMFAAHYFFETEFSARMFFYNVSLALQDGSIFYGVVPCGKRIISLLQGQVRDREDAMTFLNPPHPQGLIHVQYVKCHQEMARRLQGLWLGIHICTVTHCGQ